MQIKKLTPAEAAAFTYRLTGGKPNPEQTAKTFRENAATMREYAQKARAAKSGKYRGYTEAMALELAVDCEARAVSVPAELRKLMARG
jgi:hypothetical protein